MQPPQLALLASAALALAAPAVAQPTATASDSGLLGKRYVEASTLLLDYNNDPDNGYAVGTAINVPVAEHLDLGASFEHDWLEGDRDENFQDLGVSLTAYTQHGSCRPFVRAELGYEWWHVSDDPFYQIDVGSECLVTDRLSLSAELSWSEFLAEDWNGGSFAGAVRGNYWLSANLALYSKVTAFEGGHWAYAVGAVFAF
jgi:hypothetical protein